MEEIVFALNLEGNLGEAADTSADALARLREQISSGTESMREMQKAYRNLKGSALASDETVKGLKDRIAATKATLASNTLELVKSGKAFEKMPKPIDSATGSLRRMLTGAEDSKGPLAGLVDKLTGMRGLLGSGVIAAGLGAVAAGVGALVGAALAATAALVGYGIAAADARRSELLFLEGVSKHRNYWLEMVTGQRRAADSASVLQGAIDGVAASSPLARARIVEMQAELSRAGLRSSNLKAALEGLSIVEATQGTEAAAAFKARALGAAIYGTSIKKLSDDVKARLGGVAKAQMLSLEVQQRKLRENLGTLFRDVKIEPFLRSVANLADMLSQSTASGRALKAMVDSLVSPLIGGLSTAGPIVKKFFQGIVIGALLTAIAVLKVRNALRDAFGGKELFKRLELGTTAMYAGIAAAAGLAGAVTVLGVALGGLAALTGAAAYGLYTLAQPFIWVQKKGLELATWVVATNWQVLGATLTGGIAAGIRSGVGEVVSAMTNMGTAAIAAFKRKLGIASPSKVAFAAAFEVPRGVRNALMSGRSMVRTAAVQMASATEEGMRVGTRAAASNLGKGPSSPRADGARAERLNVTATLPSAAAASPRAPKADGPRVSPVFQFQAGAITVGGACAATEAGVQQSLRQAVEEIFKQTAVLMAA